MSALFMIAAAALLLGPLIAIHEFGHYWVARKLGVKVLVYSIGFGPTLLKWTSKKSGIKYQLSALPLGGYVKMLDEREGNVAEQDLPYAFNRQKPWKRIAIVAAGPLINLIFAVLLCPATFAIVIGPERFSKPIKPLTIFTIELNIMLEIWPVLSSDIWKACNGVY